MSFHLIHEIVQQHAQHPFFLDSSLSVPFCSFIALASVISWAGLISLDLFLTVFWLTSPIMYLIRSSSVNLCSHFTREKKVFQLCFSFILTKINIYLKTMPLNANWAHHCVICLGRDIVGPVRSYYWTFCWFFCYFNFSSVIYRFFWWPAAIWHTHFHKDVN